MSIPEEYSGKGILKSLSMTPGWYYYDESYDEENPLDTKYNQVHLPGSNARGTNFIATKEYVYIIEGEKCNLVDIRTRRSGENILTGDDEH